MSQEFLEIKNLNLHKPYGLVPVEYNILLPNKHVESLTNKMFTCFQSHFEEQFQQINQEQINQDLASLHPQMFAQCLQDKYFYINDCPQKCIFIDRDNCINDDHQGYQANYATINIFPNAYKVLARFKKLGYLIICVSNQSGISRGFFTYEQFVECMNDFADDAYNTSGFIFDAVVFTDSSDPRDIYRKPNLGSYELASKYFQIDLSKSIMIGDAPCDQQFAKNLGIKFVSVLTGATRIYDAHLVIGSIESLMHPEDYPLFTKS